MDRSGGIQLAMVRSQNDIGAVPDACILNCLTQIPDLGIHIFQGPVDFLGVDTVKMPGVVRVAQVQQKQVRLILADNITGRGSIKGPDIIRLVCAKPDIGLHDSLIEFLRGTGIGIISVERLSGLYLQASHLIHQIINRRMLAGGRPAHRSCGQSRFFAGTKNVRAPEYLMVPEPIRV